MNDPHAMTKFIIFIYCVNMVRYGYAGLWGNAWYWFAAAQITVASTWWLRR